MAKQTVTEFAIRPVTDRRSHLGRRAGQDQLLELKTPKGSVFLRKSTLEAAGDSWDRVKRRLSALSAEKNIPFRDETNET